MKRSFSFMLAVALLAASPLAGQEPTGTQQDQIDPTMKPATAPPRSDPHTNPNARRGEDSSSKDREVDISPPANDAEHPGSEMEVIEEANGVSEMKPWNPHQADKDVEVGIYYFKQNNYKAAESRFREALFWQDNHAEANYWLGNALEKLKQPSEARYYYEEYLKILPNGPLAKDAKKALSRVSSTESSRKDSKKITARP
jgi:tetratricopeptide (TPR) repeat protein